MKISSEPIWKNGGVTEPVKAVLFDFGQTLVDSADGFRTAEKEAQVRIRDDLGLDEPGASCPDTFLSEYRRLRKECQAASCYSRKTIWEAVYARFDRRADSALLEQWEDAYWQRVTAMTAPFPEAIEVLESLRRKYRIGLITNTQGQPRGSEHRLAEFPESERFFEVIIVAGESGIPAKPDPAPFVRCLSELGVEAAEAVYVGDDWRNDVCGAQDAGMRAVWLKHHTVRRNWPEIETDVPIITDLSALLDLESLLD